jgi:hypothetical protein
MGIEWLWDRECLDRALIIARTLKAEEDPSLDRAALILAALGYAPSAERLRGLLIRGVDNFTVWQTRRQTYLKSEPPAPEEKRKRLERMLRRRMPVMPDPITQKLVRFNALLHGVADVTDEVPSATIFPSLATTRERLERVDSPTLLANYERAKYVAPHMARYWEPLRSISAIYASISASSHSAMPADQGLLSGLTRDSFIALSRLLFTAVLTAFPPDLEAREEEALALKDWASDMSKALAQYVGITLPDWPDEGDDDKPAKLDSTKETMLETR